MSFNFKGKIATKMTRKKFENLLILKKKKHFSGDPRRETAHKPAAGGEESGRAAPLRHDHFRPAPVRLLRQWIRGKVTTFLWIF